MNAANKLKMLSEWHREWAEKWEHTVVVDERYANGEGSQYSETIVDMSASQEAQDDYWRVASNILDHGSRSGK